MNSNLKFDTSNLTIKQALFIKFYIETRNATLAAKKAGYGGSDNSLAVTACRNLQTKSIKDIIEKLVEENSLPTTFAKKQGRQKGGFVYLVKEPFGLVKIGKAVNLNSRLVELNTASPYPLELILAISDENPFQLEKWIHAMFSDKRVRNEWFQLSDEDIECIRSKYGKTA